MKKKIVEYIGRIQDGGAEILVKDYALLLDKDKFDVSILCDDYKQNSAVYKTLIENNVKVEILFSKHIILCKILRRLFGGRFRAILFDKKIRKIKPDVIHVHLESLETLQYSKQLEGIKLWYTCHNPPEMMIGNKNKKEQKAAHYLQKKYDMKFIALHDEMANEINKMFNIKDCKVIKNCINFKRFNELTKTKEEIRKELDIPQDAYLIGNNGRFAYQKNHEFIIKVFYEVSKVKENVYLLLIGRGKLEQEIRKQIKELGIESKVRIVSNRTDIPELLNAMDLFLFPSRFEGLGIVLIEAQLMKLHCVVSEAIPKEAFNSELITVLSLNDPIENWVEQCINPVSNISEYKNIEDYDMNKEIIKLGELYIS